MEVTASLARKETAARTGLNPDQIGVFFISPCPAKRSAVINPIGRTSSQIDGVIAIADAYPMILAKLEKLDPDAIREIDNRLLAGYSGVRWAYAGGEAIALKTDRYLAVDGIHNIIAILEEVENERLRDIDFIEANSCTGGCIGGPLTVANRFSAKSRQRGYITAARMREGLAPGSLEEREPGSQAEERIQAVLPDLEAWPEPLSANHALNLDDNILIALQKYEQMKQIAATLPGLDCGACGAPDCEALAEDIVRGEATETDCIFKLKERIRQVAAQMGELEAEMNRHATAQTSDEPVLPAPPLKADDGKGGPA
jgi:hypothetical protein